jgi:hypothetical protein
LHGTAQGTLGMLKTEVMVRMTKMVSSLSMTVRYDVFEEGKSSGQKGIYYETVVAIET